MMKFCKFVAYMMLVFFKVIVNIILTFLNFLINKITKDENSIPIDKFKFLDKNQYENEIVDLKSKINEKDNIIENLNSTVKDNESKISQLNQKLEKLDGSTYIDIQEKIKFSTEELKTLENKIQELTDKETKINKNITSQSKKLVTIKESYKSIAYCIDNFLYLDEDHKSIKIPDERIQEIDEISPSVILKLHSMDIKSLRKAYQENNKLIDETLSKYSNRYTTKTNKAIYTLMVIALRSELQNVLYNLKFEKLDVSIKIIKDLINKYLNIASEGNQTIASTLVKFIGQIEYLFINAIKIEYEYYVKKEQARQEQIILKQQMKEEAEERRMLQLQQEQMEREEQKYNNEIAKIQDMINNYDDKERVSELESKILELQNQLSEINTKKDEIVKLQNGRAGNVYIISNLGSFGENIFKIGMTRRLNPVERVDELGNASVPFKFDIHSFIFSDDAVSLENKLHTLLDDKRVNKINRRKEFFNISIDELEKLVNEIAPSAEFNKTMVAEEFKQSLSYDV